MKEYPIRFDCLTWPEVAALPRTTALVLPLGDGYDLGAIAAEWDACALLPALPYGWPGSLVAVSPPLLTQLLRNLFSCLQQDGFEKLILLHPPGIDLDLQGVECLGANQTAGPEKISGFGRRQVVLIPLGHTEQHGYHLPLNTDSVIIQAIASRTCAALPGEVFELPALPYGVSTHRRTFPGTFNLGGRAYEDFLLVVLAELFARGAERFYLLNGHGGNHSFLVNVVKFAGERIPQAFTATSWLHTAGAIGAAALVRHRESKRGGMGHAGELETSLMLHLQPEWVHLERVVDETDFIANEHYYMDWIEGGELIANPPWTDDTLSGSYGAGSLATAEKGALWLQAAVEEKVAHIRSIQDQHDRRLARRAEIGRGSENP